MPSTILVTEQALRDMEEIHDYIARDKPLAAKKLIDGFKRKFETLASFPELGARSDRAARLRPGLLNLTPSESEKAAKPREEASAR